MGGWILFWKIILIGTLAAYFVLAIVVTVGGFYNIKDFLKDLLNPEPED